MLAKCGFILCAVLFSIICSEVNSGLTTIDVAKLKADSAWWENAVFYQIYPRSFKEDGGRTNGIGNLVGITNKLQHLKDTGITAIWISQIYKSAGTEHGQDIIDFKDIHSDYGNLAEFDALITKAKEVKIKVILDFVINHSGKENKWFEESEKGTKEFKDYYVWRNATGGANRKPPNNWLSVHGDSAWEWSEIRKQYYLHQFAIDQPDLNYNTSEVLDEMKEVLTFWLGRGVDGFRLDAVPFLFEDDKFQDEPESGLPGVADYEYDSLKHIYTMDQDKTFDLIYTLREFIDKYNEEHLEETPKILMSEAYTSIENTMRYYGVAGKKGVHIPFNFQLIPHDKNTTASKIVASINQWLSKMPKGQIANWVLGNHDNHRAATRFGPELVDNMNILIASLPGIMVTYNGEEIGQEDGKVTFIQCKDPIGCNAGVEGFHRVSRDFERTPYHWDNTKYAGFTDAAAIGTWLPVSEKHTKNNLEDQKIKSTSHYGVYKAILELREKEKIRKEDVTVVALSETLIKITYGSKSNDYGNHIVLINIGKNKEKVKVTNNARGLYKVIYSTDSSMAANKKIWEKDVTLDAYKTVVLKVISQDDVTYDWWKHAVIYQIYLRSFKDEANNDGIGDLKGVTSKLKYLKELGVNAICLSSIYKSPQNDLGYDVSDFGKIDGRYGNLNDLRKLINVAESEGIKVIIDFVPNHSSEDHEWFNDNNKKNYYVWKPQGNPLNNWLSIFKGSAWTRSSPTSDDYYLHQFDSTQPDLNYGNPDVQQAMKDILTFWLEQGVDGFRMTGAQYLFEDKSFSEEPLSNNPEAKKGERKSLRHMYTSDVPRTLDVIYDWREFLDMHSAENGGNERIMITGANTDIYNTMYYYGNIDKKGAHLTLNFQLIEKVDGTSNANDFAAKINEWIDLIPEGHTSNWMLGDHDHRRVATRFGSQNVDGFNMLTAVLPGVMITYNGEEIGQEDADLHPDSCIGDPIFCPVSTSEPSENEKLRKLRRDRQRTPFHWDDSANAGFSVGKPWLNISDEYTKTNVKQQTNQKGSHYELYKRLLVLRRKEAFVEGSLKVKSVTDYVLATLREHKNGSYFHLFNLGDSDQTFNLKTAFNQSTSVLEVVETNDHTKLDIGTLLDANSITLEGHKSVIVIFTDKTIPGSATIQAISSIVLVLSLLISIINNF